MSSKTKRESGFSLVEIMVVVGLIGLLAALALPKVARARAARQKAVCMANVPQIDSTISLWAAKQAGARWN